MVMVMFDDSIPSHFQSSHCLPTRIVQSSAAAPLTDKESINFEDELYPSNLVNCNNGG